MEDDSDSNVQEDETESGESLEFLIGVEDDRIIVDFGKPVVWYTMNVDEASRFVSMINERIESIKRKGLKYETETVQ